MTCLGCNLLMIPARCVTRGGVTVCDECPTLQPLLPAPPSEVMRAAKLRHAKMIAAGFTRRKTGKTAGGLMLDPDDLIGSAK